MNGLEIIKAPETTVDQIADIISKPCPPEVPVSCDDISCKDCWLVWLTGAGLSEKTEPPTEQTAPSCERCPLQGKKREIIQLGTFLKEVRDYVSHPAHGRTSQSQ